MIVYPSLFVQNKQFVVETKHAVGQDSETRVLRFVLHQRPTSTVHLVGSFILRHVLSSLRTGERERCDSVLMLVSLTTRVLLLSGVEATCITGTAGYSTVVLHLSLFILARCMKSSDDVTLHQVHGIIIALFT